MYADRVKDTTLSTGTGAITLAGVAPTGYQTFAAGFGASAVTVSYCIADQAGNNWEVGVGTFNGTTGLTRTTVLGSSNAGAAVAFTAGTKDVFCTAPAKYLDTFTSTNQGTVPASGGGTSNFLRADGTFAAPAATAPASPTTSVQFNNAGAFGGSANFTYNTGTNTFTVGPAGATTIIETLAPTGSTVAGTIRFRGKNASATNGAGGGFQYAGGNALGTGTGGGHNFSCGTGRIGGAISFVSANGTFDGGAMSFNAGIADAGGTGGNFVMTAGIGATTANGGNFEMTAGAAASSGFGGSFIMLAGGSVSGAGGDFTLASGFGVPSGSIYLGADSGTVIQITQDAVPNLQLGFFGATPVAKPTSVAVTAAGIHAALVSLGLIS
jgi:hypothetical protein